MSEGCPGCEATVVAQRANKDAVKKQAQDYANTHHIYVVLYMEMGEWRYTTVSAAYAQGIPFDPANVLRFDSVVTPG